MWLSSDGAAMTEQARPPEILIVDDNPLIAYLLTEAMLDEGYRAETITGADVIALAFATPPRLVLLDVLMPGLDGPAVSRQLRADPRTADVRIVFISALPPAALAVRLAGCPYDAIIAKPFDLDVVSETVRRFLTAPTD